MVHDVKYFALFCNMKTFVESGQINKDFKSEPVNSKSATVQTEILNCLKH